MSTNETLLWSTTQNCLKFECSKTLNRIFYCLLPRFHSFHGKPILALKQIRHVSQRQNRLHVYQNSHFILCFGNSNWSETRTNSSSETASVVLFEFIKVLQFACGVWDNLWGKRGGEILYIFTKKHIHELTQTHWNLRSHLTVSLPGFHPAGHTDITDTESQ